jgi:acetyl-CoA C-acetyltransferase
MPEALILSAARTPIGKFLSAFADIPAPQLGAIAVAEALRRANVPPGRVDEVIIGNVLQAGLGQNPARQTALKAGLPDTIAAYTVNKVCGSGLKAAMLAAQAIRAGDAEVVVAGGIENMSRAPYLLVGARNGWKFGDQKVVDEMAFDGLTCPFENWPMGEAAEHIANKCGVTRADQDRFSAQSQRRAAAAPSRRRSCRSRLGAARKQKSSPPTKVRGRKRLPKDSPSSARHSAATAASRLATLRC